MLAISILLIFCLLLGVPLFAVLLAAALLGFYSSGIEPAIIGVELYRIADTPLLSSLPLFTFAGYLLSESNTSQRLLRLIQSLFGWMPDGLAVVSLVACAIFTALTGASGVTILALGALLLPSLLKAGYPERFSLGLITSSGSLGLLLPPSIPLIIYGIIVQQMEGGIAFSLRDLMLSGLIPGLLMLLVLSGWVMWVNRDREIPKTPFNKQLALQALWESKWEIPLPFFIFGGIFSGVLAVSEMAAVAALYVLLVECFIYREIPLNALPDIVSKSMRMVGGIILILGVSMAFTNFLIDAQIPNILFDWVQHFVDNKYTFLLFLNIFLLVLGAVLDIYSAIVVVVPLILPVAMGFGIHPIHLGIIFLANMQIGYFTPPVGMNLFIASYRFQRPITELYQASIPFMLVLFVTVLAITYWPDLSLFFVD